MVGKALCGRSASRFLPANLHRGNSPFTAKGAQLTASGPDDARSVDPSLTLANGSAECETATHIELRVDWPTGPGRMPRLSFGGLSWRERDVSVSVRISLSHGLAAMRILVTGASGFIGTRVSARLAKCGYCLTLLGGMRVPAMPSAGEHVVHAVGRLETATSLPMLLQGIEVVIHLAGRAHVLREASANPAGAFRAANTDAVAHLCAAMVQVGVKRLVLVSSIAAKLQKNEFGRSKAVGESAAMKFAKAGGYVTILRPPLVYGAGAPGNLDRLIRLIRTGLPLPFSRVRNRRSLCAAENLADAIVAIVQSDRRVSEILEVCDDAVVSLPEIVQALAEGLEQRVIMFPAPANWLSAVAGMVSRSMAEGLFGDLVLDNRMLREAFGFVPAVMTRDGISAVGAAMRSRYRPTH